MPVFDEGLINGDTWGATQIDAMEMAISDRGIEVATTSQRNTIAGARLFDGKTVYDTTLHELVHYKTGDTLWHGVRSHQFWQGGGNTTDFTDNSAHTANSGTLPDYGVNGVWLVTAQLYVIRGSGGTQGAGVYVDLTLGGTNVSEIRVEPGATFGYNATLIGKVHQNAGATTAFVVAWTQQSPGNLPLHSTNDGRFNQLSAIFVPD